MGGNVFPGKSRRYDRQEYLEVESYVKTYTLPRIYSKFEVCKYSTDKQTFGDMDVVGVPKFPLSKSFLQSVFNTIHVEHNGPTWSLLFGQLQIDLITTQEEHYDFHRAYLGVYDAGNFYGKIAHMLGLKFGHDGLYLPLRYSDSHKLADILLTLDPKEATDFLDIYPKESVECIEDVFEPVVKSKYFNPETFLLENNNAIARVRDKKRPSYNAFLEYIGTLPKRDYFPRTKDKSIHLPLIFERFPNVKIEYELQFAKKKLIEETKVKFNGHVVSELTGLNGEDLGRFIRYLKASHYFSPHYMVELTQEQINRNIQYVYKYFSRK